MKKLFLLFALITGTISSAQVFNFYGSEYYIAPDSNTTPGTALTASGTSLAAFDYSTSDPNHPLFTQGIYYAIQDCGDRNLWIRLQHIAADPNGTSNGANIAQTLNTPFYPPGSTDRIGGFNGFLYDIRIFGDQSLTGVRANTLNGSFLTNITVESLETLFNDGGFQFEWLSFEILNSETSGWSLNSINFTGINLNSTPGFSSELHYADTGTPTSAPIGFSTDFPSGSSNIYAVDMNLSGQEHSEFRMSASAVSHFRYGYEFNSGGYQGMSMAFGGVPIINSNVVSPLCSDSHDGTIQLEVTGTQPLDYLWSNGAEVNSLSGINAGEYTVTITDPAGCVATQTFTVSAPDPLTVTIIEGEGSLGHYLQAITAGGTTPFLSSINWSSGSSEGDFNYTSVSGVYSVDVTDTNGCTQTASFNLVGINELSDDENTVYPNPAGEMLFIKSNEKIIQVEIFNSIGQTIQIHSISALPINISELNKGIYFYRIFLNSSIKTGSFIKE